MRQSIDPSGNFVFYEIFFDSNFFVKPLFYLDRYPSPHADDGPETWPWTPDSMRTSVRWRLTTKDNYGHRKALNNGDPLANMQNQIFFLQLFEVYKKN